LLVSLVLGACTESDTSDDQPGTPGCEMQIVSVVPAQPGVGDMVVVMGQIEKTNAPGIEVFEWAVDREGTAITVMPENTPEAREVFFIADQVGVYTVTLSGTAGSLDCSDAADATVNVSAATAWE
jgi:hypothetical protein